MFMPIQKGNVDLTVLAQDETGAQFDTPQLRPSGVEVQSPPLKPFALHATPDLLSLSPRHSLGVILSADTWCLRHAAVPTLHEAIMWTPREPVNHETPREDRRYFRLRVGSTSRSIGKRPQKRRPGFEGRPLIN